MLYCGLTSAYIFKIFMYKKLNDMCGKVSVKYYSTFRCTCVTFNILSLKITQKGKHHKK